MVTQVVLSLETREELLSNCPEMTNFVNWLDSIDRRPGLDELALKLSNLKPNSAALENCIGYAKVGYQRHVVKKNDFYELAIICWKPYLYFSHWPFYPLLWRFRQRNWLRYGLGYGWLMFLRT